MPLENVLMCTLTQAARQGPSARIRFASASRIFNFAVCFRRPRYRVFRNRSCCFTTAKTCSTLARAEHVSRSLCLICALDHALFLVLGRRGSLDKSGIYNGSFFRIQPRFVKNSTTCVKKFFLKSILQQKIAESAQDITIRNLIAGFSPAEVRKSAAVYHSSPYLIGGIPPEGCPSGGIFKTGQCR